MIVYCRMVPRIDCSLSAGHWGIKLSKLWPLELEERLRIEWDMVKRVKISILPISQSILNRFPSSKESFWREFTGEYSHTQKTGCNRLQPVFFSVKIWGNCNRDWSQPSATATEGPVFSGSVRSSCGLFPVLVTGPQNTSREPSFALFLSDIGLTFVFRARSAVNFALCSVL